MRRAESFFDTPAFGNVTTADDRQMLTQLHRDVRKIRNSIQHAEERFAEGRIPEGEPLIPAMTSDCLYFAEEYIPYAEVTALAMIVWQLANVAVRAARTS